MKLGQPQSKGLQCTHRVLETQVITIIHQLCETDNFFVVFVCNHLHVERAWSINWVIRWCNPFLDVIVVFDVLFVNLLLLLLGWFCLGDRRCCLFLLFNVFYFFFLIVEQGNTHGTPAKHSSATEFDASSIVRSCHDGELAFVVFCNNSNICIGYVLLFSFGSYHNIKVVPLGECRKEFNAFDFETISYSVVELGFRVGVFDVGVGM
mmetsp:Transcript_14820/g.22564  ORF Transcript_14820/g.22564 Transcript_14820/m.22564 type:complete len:207 (+) Transcript_14820:184-804(+)